MFIIGWYVTNEKNNVFKNKNCDRCQPSVTKTKVFLNNHLINLYHKVFNLFGKNDGAFIRNVFLLLELRIGFQYRLGNLILNRSKRNESTSINDLLKDDKTNKIILTTIMIMFNNKYLYYCKIFPSVPKSHRRFSLLSREHPTIVLLDIIGVTMKSINGYSSLVFSKIFGELFICTV